MADNCFIKIIARYLDRCGNHHTPKGNYRNICGSSPDIDNHIAKRTVRLGDSNRQFVEVLSGLNPGDSVVVSDMEQFKSVKSLKLK